LGDAAEVEKNQILSNFMQYPASPETVPEKTLALPISRLLLKGDETASFSRVTADVLYQGTTLVGPKKPNKDLGFNP
jgi:hypothetical protein